MLENTLFPSIGDPVTKLPECDIHDKHHFHKPPHAFTLQEQFMETVNRVNDTLARVVRQSEFMKKSVEEFTSKLSADNVTFKDLVVSTYNNFSSVVTAEVNAFETEIKNSYQAFSDDVKLNWDNFQLNYADFETQINDKITAFENKTDTAFEEYKTLVNQGFEDFKTELTEMLNTHKSEMNETYDNFRDAIESRLQQYDANYVKSFTDYCTSMNNNLAQMESQFNKNYANFTSAINASITEFKNEWTGIITARLDGQDSVINDAVLYMKTNLTASLNQIVDELIVEGRIDTITTATYQTIKNRIPNIINVVDYANLHRDSNGEFNGDILIDIMMQSFTSEPEKYKNVTFYFPNGIYTFGSDRSLPLISFWSIIGESKSGVIFKFSGTEGIILVNSTGDEENNIEYTTLKNVTLLGGNYDCTAIQTISPISHLIIDNVSIDGFTNAIDLSHGLWVSQLSNIDIANCDVGINIGSPSTSTNLKNVYVMSSTYIAYKIVGLGYSSWQNVCADWCKGTVYDFTSCSINIDGMGAECQESTTFLKADTATLNINNATVFTNQESADYTMFNVHNSNVTINGISVDTYDGVQHETQGKLYTLVNDAKLTINAMKANTTFKTPSTSSDPDNVFTYTDRNNNYTVNNHKTVIGMPLGVGERSIKIADRDYLTNSIWSNNVAHPRNGLAHDDRYGIARQCGDLFINNQPYLTGVALWQQVTSCEPITFEGDYTVTNNLDGSFKITIKNYSFSDRAKAFFGDEVQHAMYMMEQAGLTLPCKIEGIEDELVIKAVWDNMNPSPDVGIIFDITGKNGDLIITGDGGEYDAVLFEKSGDTELSILATRKLTWLCSSTIGNTEFRPVQHLMCLSGEEIFQLSMLNYPYLTDGIMVFETDEKKPLWYYNKNFYHADGTPYFD